MKPESAMKTRAAVISVGRVPRYGASGFRMGAVKCARQASRNGMRLATQGLDVLLLMVLGLP
jgi:hypothetical protein